ncbi:MAG: helix-turn-helix transcriptional regulator [Defluviitaleaceae bacterium]|nr:helix-turn-helix transcriptional regulator [Defluviitaleaceae bacterium]
MARIRVALKKTQLDLAIAMGYSSSLIGNYENGRCPVSADVLIAFRQETHMTDVPITDSEVEAMKNELRAWNDTVTYGDIKLAAELYHILARRVRWSYDTGLQTLFDLFCTKYYFRLGKKDEYDRLFVALSKMEDGLDGELLYWYYCLCGFCYHTQWRYKQALAMYFKAEAVGNRLHVNDRALYYNIGSCLINCGYPYLAVMNFEKFQVYKYDLASVRLGFATQKLLAIGYSKIGKTNKAIQMLNDCREYVTNNKSDDNPTLYEIYFSLGKVFHEAGDYDKAHENLNKASHYCNKNDESYVEYLCYAATFFREYNKTDKAIECLNKCIPLVAKGTLWYEWLHALKHSVTLDDKASADYMVWTAIPALHEYGMCTVVMKCFDWLSKHYEEKGMYKPALKYANEASNIFYMLMKGNLALLRIVAN